MWVLKIKVSSEKQALGALAIRHNISMASYMLSPHSDKKSLYITGAGFLFGTEKNKKEFVKDLKKQLWVIKLEVKNDFGIALLKQPLFTKEIWNPEIIQLSPIIIRPQEKVHVWNFASFNRKALEKVIQISEKYLEGEVLKFKEEKISNISFTKLLPELTKNQKRALELAINDGYYDYPKKIKMEELAKKMKIAYSTFQAHLKKAESKILPEIYKEL